MSILSKRLGRSAVIAAVFMIPSVAALGLLSARAQTNGVDPNDLIPIPTQSRFPNSFAPAISLQQQSSVGGFRSIGGFRAPNQDEQLEINLAALLRAAAKGDVQMSSEELETKKNELSEIVNKQFDKRHDEQSQALERAELDAKKLRQTLEARLEAKSQIVERRIQELLGEPDPMGWAPDPSPSGGVWMHYASPRDASWRPVPNQHANANPYAHALPQTPPQAVPPPLPNIPSSSVEGPTKSERSKTSSMFGIRISSAGDADVTRIQAEPQVGSNGFAAAEQFVRQQIELNELQSELKQIKELYARGAIPQSEVQKTEARIKALEASNRLLEMQMSQAEQMAKLRFQNASDAVRQAPRGEKDSSGAVKINIEKEGEARRDYEVARLAASQLHELRKMIEQLTSTESNTSTATEEDTKVESVSAESEQ